MFFSHKLAWANSGFTQPVMTSRSAHITFRDPRTSSPIVWAVGTWTPLITSNFMTRYYHCVIASLRNIVHPNCSLNVSMSRVMHFPFSLHQVFATRTYKVKLLKFKPQLFQRAPNITTVLSGLCTTSSPNFTTSNPFPQHQRFCQVLSRWSVSSSSSTRLFTFQHSTNSTICVRSTLPPLITSGSSSHSKAWKNWNAIFPYASYQSHQTCF